jgi:hypothetical protein
VGSYTLTLIAKQDESDFGAAIFVENLTVSGGTTVNISAGTPPAGKQFKN